MIILYGKFEALAPFPQAYTPRFSAERSSVVSAQQPPSRPSVIIPVSSYPEPEGATFELLIENFATVSSIMHLTDDGADKL